jgi:NADPH:quinone reductase-like Zn-dependent oxidoreductase
MITTVATLLLHSPAIGKPMKAIRIDQYGDESVLQVVAVPRPRPARNQLLVNVYAAGVNPLDWKIRDGAGARFGKNLPIFLGSEISGVVVEVGEEVTGLNVGDAVYGLVKAGGYAEYVLVNADEVALKPAGIDFLQAAAIPLAGLTAWQAMFDLGKLRAGQTMLITAAAGGVGSLAVQLAKAKGAVVIGMASGKNESFVRDLGADEFVDYTRQPFDEVVTGMDLVFDTVGGETFERAVACVKKGGTIVTSVAFPTSQHVADGVHALRVSCQPNRYELDQISQLVIAGQLRAHVAQVFPLAQVGDAHRLSKQGRTSGKIVLQIDTNH